MGWRVSARDDPHRFIAWTDEEGGMGRLEGDEPSLEELAQIIDSDAAVALTPTGPFRDVADAGDEVGVYLIARQAVIPWPHDIIGSPPSEEIDAAEIPEGAVA